MLSTAKWRLKLIKNIFLSILLLIITNYKYVEKLLITQLLNIR